jgi:hypothetical protein
MYISPKCLNPDVNFKKITVILVPAISSFKSGPRSNVTKEKY